MIIAITITLPTGAFILFLLLAFMAGLIVSFLVCRHAADTVYHEAEEEQTVRFTSGMDKFLS